MEVVGHLNGGSKLSVFILFQTEDSEVFKGHIYIYRQARVREGEREEEMPKMLVNGICNCEKR